VCVWGLRRGCSSSISCVRKMSTNGKVDMVGVRGARTRRGKRNHQRAWGSDLLEKRERRGRTFPPSKKKKNGGRVKIHKIMAYIMLISSQVASENAPMFPLLRNVTFVLGSLC